jgi:hypothetical protein
LPAGGWKVFFSHIKNKKSPAFSKQGIYDS